MMKMKIPVPVEAALRSTGMACLCYILTVSSWPNAVPTYLKLLIGILGSIFALPLTKFCYGIGAGMPTMLLQFLLCLVLETILLAAATVSTGLLVVVFSIMTIALSGMYFGPDFEKTMGLVNVLFFLPGFLALNLAPLVQHGFSVMVPFDLLPLDSYDFVEIVLSKICLQEGQEADCWETANDNLFSGPYEIQIPRASSDVFGGQTALVTVDEGGVEIRIPGGMWVVKGLWKWQGLDNPLAVHRNFMICICWIAVCYAISLLTPPWRTAREQLSRRIVPDALQTMATRPAAAPTTPEVPQQQPTASASSTPAAAAESPDESLQVAPAAGEEATKTTTNGGPSSVDDDDEMVVEVRSKLVQKWKVVEGGAIARVTTFEPRLCRAPFEYTVPALQNLLIQTEMAILSFLLHPNEEMLLPNDQKKQNNNNNDDDDDSDNNNNDEQSRASDLQTAHALLKTSAEALTNMDASTLESMKEGISVDDDDVFGDADNAAANPSRVLLYRANKVRQVALEWIQVMQEPAPTPIRGIPQNLWNTYKPWVLSPILALKRVPMLLLIPFNPRNWSSKSSRTRTCRNFLWALKLVAGFIALFVMTVYWDGYKQYAIQVGAHPAEELFFGWHLAAYTFAYRPTAEGTFKKGLQRLVGTCAGAFGAWLAIIVCSGSYEEHAEVNPYALVVWLTITTGVVAYLSVDKGDAAQTGVSPDHGFFGVYTVFTQALIALSYYTGSDSRDNLTVNRLVANLTGVLMAIVVAFLPPALFGAALHSIQEYYDALENEWEVVLKGVQEGNDNEAFSKAAQEQSSYRRRLAMFLIQDSDTLVSLPIFRIDPSYRHLVGRMAVTESLMRHFLELLDFAPISSEDRSLMSSLKVPDSSMVGLGEDGATSLHISTAKKIQNRLLAHREDLAKLSRKGSLRRSEAK